MEFRRKKTVLRGKFVVANVYFKSRNKSYQQPNFISQRTRKKKNHT